MRPIAIVVLMCLTGCASMESTRLPASKYAPTNEVRGGTVKYNNQGWGKDGRRENAYKKMHKHCGGPYQIVNEWSGRESGGVAVPVGGIYAMPSGSWTHIQFQCEEK